MFRLVLLILAITASISCAKKLDEDYISEEALESDVELIPHVREFYSLLKTNKGFELPMLSVRFSDKAIGAAGICVKVPGTLGFVRVNAFYKDAPPSKLKQIVFHELGHCVLNLPHTSSGIMNEVIEPVREEDYIQMFRIGSRCSDVFNRTRGDPPSSGYLGPALSLYYIENIIIILS